MVVRRRRRLLARLAEEMCTMLLQLPCRVFDPSDHASIQTKWLLHSSIEDLPSYLHDQKAVRPLAENSKNIRDKAYGDSTEILPVLSLLVEEKISAPASAVVEGISTKRSVYSSIVDEALSEGDASSEFMVASWRDRNTAMDCVGGKNSSMSCLKSLLHFGSNTKVHNLRKHWPILMAGVQDMCFNINSASMASWDSSLQKNQVLTKGSCNRLLDNESDDSKERMSVDSAGNGAAIDNAVLPLLSQAKCGPLPEPSSSHLIELQSDQQSPWSSHTAHMNLASAQDIDRQQLAACSKSNAQIQENVEFSRGDTEWQIVDASRNRCQKVQIFIRHCSGQVVLMVNLDESSKLMMDLFEKKTKMKLVHHYFKYRNSIIDPNCTLLSYGVGRNAIVEACGRLLGGMPPTLDEYLPKNKLRFLRKVTRPDGKESVDMKKKGCRILSSLLKCFTKSFAKGKSWGGRVTKKHFKVVNEHVMVLIKAELNLDTDNLKADIAVLVCWIKSTFSLDTKFPPYLEDLIAFLESRNYPTLLRRERIYIETHISCIESSDRGMLLVLLRKKYKSLSKYDQRRWEKLMLKLDLPGGTNFLESLEEVAVFKDIIKKAEGRGKGYDNKKSSICSLLRDEFTHGVEHRFDKSTKPWKERFKADDGIELMIPAYAGHFPAKVIQQLVESPFDITAELLACQVRCCCSYCQETSSKTEATSSKHLDDQDASGLGSSSNKETTGSGSSQQLESSVNKENPVSHAAASNKGLSLEAESSLKEQKPKSYKDVLKKGIPASPEPPSSVPPQKPPSSDANKPKPPPREDDDGFQVFKHKKGNRRQ